MKKTVGLFAAIVMTMVMLSTPLSVSAASKSSSDGLDVSIETDIENYTLDEDKRISMTQVQISVTVENTNANNVNNVDIDIELPKELMLKSGDLSYKQIELPTGKIFKAEAVAMKIQTESGINNIDNKDADKDEPENEQDGEKNINDNETNNTDSNKQNTTDISKEKDVSPKTGDNFSPSIFVVLILFSATGMLIVFRRYRRIGKSTISFLLCLVMVINVIPMKVFAAENNTKKLCVEKVLKIDEHELIFRATVHYEVPIENTEYLVLFDLNHDDADEFVEQQKVKYGETIKYPGSPSRDNYAFAGWYLDNNKSDLSKPYDFTKAVFSDMMLYAKWIEIVTDSDGDGIPDEVEQFRFNSDPKKEDTDKDGLNDYQECIILGTNPLMSDTDNDNILDINEDADNDGLTNGEEFSLNTNPISIDTDFDGINDFDEVKGSGYHTNPLKEDTDEDGASDEWETVNGFDPTVYNKSFSITSNVEFENTTASVDVTLSGNKAESLIIEPVIDDPMLTNSIPGYIDVPVKFEVDDNLDGASAIISFKLNADLFDEKDFCPTIYYFNEKTQLLEELSTRIKGTTVSATVTHFSKYILLNKTEFDSVWDTEIKPPLYDNDNNEESTLDIMFVIDYSASMDENDPNQLFKSLSKEFIEKLRKGKDKSGAVKFIRCAEIVSKLTSEKNDVIDSIYNIEYDDGWSWNSGTDGSTGIKLALDELELSDSNYQYIVFITDGEDNSYSYSYDLLIDNAKQKNISVFTIGMGSANESILKKIANETNGKYYHATANISSEELLDLNAVFADIESETVDLTTDTDGDKIPDYYEVRLLTGSGIPMNLDPNNPDCDGDRLKDGEEITIATDSSGKVYAKVISNPWLYDTDGDMYSDFDEIKKYGSDPKIINIAFNESDISFLVSNKNFVSNKYLNFYENKWYGWLEQGSVWIGNNVFGSNYDKTYLYKCALMEYLEQMVKEEENDSQIKEVIKYSRDLFAQINENIDKAAKLTEDSAEYLKNLKQQVNNCQKSMDELINGNLINKGLTKQQFYRLWDDTFDTYRKASEKIPELERKIQFNSKIKKASDAFGIVLDVMDLGITTYEFFDNINAFESKISEMDSLLDILKIIYSSTNAPSELKTAANELYRAIEQQKAKNLDAFFDAVGAIGGKALKLTLTNSLVLLKIPVIGKYLATVKAVLDISDFVFHVSNVAEECSYLYAISKSSSILAESYTQVMKQSVKHSNWNNLYINYSNASHQYFSLAIMRKRSEIQMKTADKANSFLIEWLFTEVMYKVDDIDANISKIDKIKYNYSLIP